MPFTRFQLHNQFVFSANIYVLWARIQPNSETPTIAELLMIRMDGLDQTTRRKSLKQLLGLTSMVCCGATWGVEDPGIQPIGPASHCPGMNLAAALAAERMGPSPDPERPNEEISPSRDGIVPARMSLMRLLEEADTYCYVEEKKEEKGSDSVCCVCMGRKKGAAFIPCGHTFCRVCSRELWLNRGSCPLCNRVVTEILDIY